MVRRTKKSSPYQRFTPKKPSLVTIERPHNHLKTQDPPNKYQMLDLAHINITHARTIQSNPIWDITQIYSPD